MIFADGSADQIAWLKKRGVRAAERVAGESACRLRARSFRPVHIERKAKHDEACLFAGRQFDEPPGIIAELPALNGLDRGCYPAGDIADRNADRPGSEIKADDGCAGE